MVYDLSPEAEGALELISLTLDREITFLTIDKWEDKKSVKDRLDRIKMHDTLLNRMLTRAVDLYDLSDKSIGNKDVKNVIDKVTKIYSVFKNRAENYLSKEDWLSYIDSQDETMKAEIEFQSDVSNIMSKLTVKYKKLPSLTDTGTIKVNTLGGKPVPLTFRKGFETKFPDIKATMDTKLSESKVKGKKK